MASRRMICAAPSPCRARNDGRKNLSATGRVPSGESRSAPNATDAAPEPSCTPTAYETPDDAALGIV